MIALSTPMEACKDIIGGEGWRAGHLAKKLGGTYMDKGMLCCEFDNLSAMLKLAQELKGDYYWNGVQKQGNSSDENKGDKDWAESDSLEQALQRMHDTPQFYNNFTEQEGKLFSEETSGNVVQYGTTGEFLDVSRYLENDPECFGSTHFGSPTVRLVTIKINIDTPFYVSKKHIARRNAWVCALVDYLENNNVRCRVQAIESTECAHIDLMVKDFQEPLNINNVAIAASSDYLRRVLFLFDEFSETWSYGYGSSNCNFWHKKPDPDSELTIAVERLGDISTHEIDTAFIALMKKFNKGEIFDNEKYLVEGGYYVKKVL